MTPNQIKVGHAATAIKEPPRHSWYVVSTALSSCKLLLECAKTGLRGSVANPSKEEWAAAFRAPERPYPWTGGDERIEICEKKR